jgi:hypothetical protein
VVHAVDGAEASQFLEEVRGRASAMSSTRVLRGGSSIG